MFYYFLFKGLVRRRTRNFEARLRRTNKPRKKVKITFLIKIKILKKKNEKTCQMGCFIISAGSDHDPAAAAVNTPEKLLSGF